MKHATGRRPGAGRALLGVASALIVVAALSRFGAESGPPSRPGSQEHETYRLIHSIGNDETIVARDLPGRECELRKKDNIAVSQVIGVHSERPGIGSITCLPETLFKD